MSETVYGIQVRRTQPRVDGTIQLWKSWPDGAKCLVLELLATEVPDDRGRPMGNGITPWRMLHFKDGPRCLFDQDRDVWVAPPGIEAIHLWLSSRESPVLRTIDPRRAP